MHLSRQSVEGKEDRSGIQWSFLLILSMAYLATSINMQGVLALMPFIREEFALARAQAGLYSAAFFLTATLMAVFSGRIVDLIGSKKGIVFGVFSMGVLIILQSFSPVYSVLLFLAFCTGIGFSIITPSVNSAVMKNVAAEQRAISMGIMQSGGGIGGFVGASLLPYLGIMIGWRMAVLLAGVGSVVFGILISRFYSEQTESDEQKADKTRPDSESLSFRESLGRIAGNKKFLSVCILGLAFGVTIGAIPAHYTIYLTQDINLSRAVAGLCLGVLQIGGILGRPIWGWVSDRLLGGSRSRGLMWVGLTFSVLALIFSLYITEFIPSVVVVGFFSLLLGMVGLGWMGLYFTAVAEMATDKLTGMATGFALIFTRSGVVLSPPLFGYLADIGNSYRNSWFAAGVLILSFTLFFAFATSRMTASGAE